MAKRSVKVKIDGMQDGELTIAGGTVADNVPPDTLLVNKGGDVDLEAKNISGKVVAAGGDVISFANQVIVPLNELTELLKMNLTQRDQIENLQEIVSDLKIQINIGTKDRNESKVKMLLHNLGGLLSLATLATTQVDKARQLFDMVKNLLQG